ncbi:MAG: hypothetical protein K8U03_07215 [Planctomycetia bacterium]|nr:hypothetical protein [Planctomycetia bacterium]
MNDEQKVVKRASAKRRIIDGLLVSAVSIVAIFIYPIGLIGMLGDHLVLSVLGIAFWVGIAIAAYGVIRLLWLRRAISK